MLRSRPVRKLKPDWPAPEYHTERLATDTFSAIGDRGIFFLEGGNYVARCRGAQGLGYTYSALRLYYIQGNEKLEDFPFFLFLFSFFFFLGGEMREDGLVLHTY